MKKYLSILAFVALIMPSVALAAWWNPLSWFHTNTQSTLVTHTASVSATSTSTLSATSTTTPTIATTSQPVVKKTSTIKKITPPTNTVVQTPASATPPKTFTLPSGAVIDSSGNIITPAPTQQQTAPSQDDQTIGQNYYNTYRTCVGLTDSNQYSDCLSYFYSQSNAQAAQQNQAYETDTQNALSQQQEQTQDQKTTELNAINLQIANLNAKYAKDLAAAENEGDTVSISQGAMRLVTQNYTIAYDALLARYQQIEYGN